MKPIQLANVLIKILGLSLCAHGIMPAVELFLQIFGSDLWMQFSRINMSSSLMSGNMLWYVFFVNLIPVLIGIVLIVFSRSVAAFLFSDEE